MAGGFETKRKQAGGGGGGGGAWSSITGTPTEVAYFDALGNGTSDANFTTTATLFNLSRTPSAGYVGNAFISDDTLGAGIPGMGFYAQTANGSNGVFIIDASSLGGTTDQSFYGFSNPFGGPTAEMQSRYNAGTDEANLDFNVENSLGKQVRVQMNSRTTGTSAGVTIYGVNASGSNSVFSVRDSGGARLLFLDNDGNLQINNAWYLPNTQGTLGQFLRADGVGGSSWATIPTPTVTLTATQIGFGDGSNLLSGTGNFTYGSTYSLVTQKVPLNADSLTYGAASFTGSGLDDLTLTWNSSIYSSNKYGGNLVIQIDTTGTPDTFNWYFTGSYSQTIGSGTSVAITGGVQTLNDADGNKIAEIQFGATTGHTVNDQWSASTSLGGNQKGYLLADGNGHDFLKVETNGGTYRLGDDGTNGGSAWWGNGTQLVITDGTGELDLFAPRYLRFEHPDTGTYTAALVDMQNQIWDTYGRFRVKDSSNKTWFEVLSASGVVNIGDVGGSYNKTKSVINDSTKTIQDYVEDSNRRIIAPSKTLTNLTANSIFEVALPAGAMTGGTITATVIATDGTDVQAHSDVVTYAAVNKAGVYTTQITTDPAHDAVAESSGTLAPTWTITTGTDKITIQVDPNSSLTTTSVKIYFQVDNNDGHLLTLL